MRACPLVLGGRQYAASSDGGHLRGAPQRGHVSPALVCLDFYVLTAGKARVSSLGGCFPGLGGAGGGGGLGTRVVGKRSGTLDGFGERGMLACGPEGWESEPLVLRRARTPRAWLCLLLFWVL